MSGSLSANIPTLLTQYTNYVSGTLVTDADFQDAAQCLDIVFDTILKTPNIANLTAVWNFFVSNQNGITQQGIALAGINVLNQASQLRYNLLYSLFTNAVNGFSPVVDAGLAPIVAGAPSLITFLQNQANIISPPTVLPNPVVDTASESVLNAILTTLSNLVSSVATVTNQTSANFILSNLATYLAPLSAAANNGTVTISGQVSTILAGFAPNGNVASLTVTTASNITTLPVGSTVAITNIGQNGAYVTIGETSTVVASTSGIYVPGGGSVGIAVGSNTHIASITLSGSTTLSLAGGSGIYTNTSGIEASGGGGPVTQSGSWNVGLLGSLPDTATNSLATLATGQATTNTTLTSIVNSLTTSATSALQTAANNTLTAISGYLNTLVSTVSGGKIAVSGTFWQSTQPISGSVNLNGNLPDTSNNALTTVATAQGVSGTGIIPPTGGSGIVGFLSGIYNKLANTLSVSVSGTVPVSGAFYPATQPVSGNVTLTGSLPDTSGGSLATIATGVAASATAANQTTGNTTLTSILSVLGNIATTSLQAVANTTLTSIATALSTANGYLSTVASTNTALSGVVSNNRLLTVDGNMLPKGVFQVVVGISAQSIAGLLNQATTISSSGTGSVAVIPTGARIVWIIPEASGVSIRMCDDGGMPTPTYGIPIPAGETFPVETSVLTINLISQDASNSAIVNLWFLG